MSEKRVAFVLYGYPLGVSPMIINSIVLFAREGYGVDVYMDEETFRVSPIEFREPGVRMITYNGSRNLFVRAWAVIAPRLAGRIRLFEWAARVLPLALAILIVFPRLFFFARWLRKQLNAVYVMPVETFSLLTLHNQPQARIVYYNMELLDWSRENPLYECKLVLKQLEFRLLKRVDLVAIQSPQRAAMFAEINRFPRERIAILPVAAMGEPVLDRSRFFRDLFSIPQSDTLVVYSGNFLPWAQCVEIIESVAQWPAGCSLVMHTWNAGALRGQYFREMQETAKGLPVHFSTEYIEHDQLAPALSSGDIGILLYEAIDGNFTEILFSSNKLAEYLKAGLPVICSDFPSLREYVESKDIGVAVASAAAIPDAVAAIRARLEEMRAGVRLAYEEDFRFERHFVEFLSILRTSDDS